MSRQKFRYIALLSFGLLLAPIAEGAVVANYLFNSGSAASNDSASNSIAQPFVVSGNTVGSDTGFSSGGNVYLRGTSYTTSEAGAVLANDYFEFTITPTGGAALDLTSVSFVIGGSGATTPPTAAFTPTVALRSNAEAADFTTDLGTASYSFPAGQAAASFGSTATINLTGPEFQNVSTPVTFRFYAWAPDATATAGQSTDSGQIIRLDTVVLNATQVVPEPSRVLLLFAGLGLLVGRRRR